MGDLCEAGSAIGAGQKGYEGFLFISGVVVVDLEGLAGVE